MLMDLRGNCGNPCDEDKRRILPETGNADEDGEHFRWWGKE
ncbi:hypothetical protein A2U01_0080846, partial [Trifolium medium]|nr:hypothetical protein [Trifolium medium]